MSNDPRFEYPQYQDEDGDWMTAFPFDKTPYEILQETLERRRQHERTMAIVNRMIEREMQSGRETRASRILTPEAYREYLRDRFYRDLSN